MQLYQIYERDRATLVRYANTLTQHKEDAEDLVQQAYVKAIMQEALFDTMHPNQVMAWLYQTIKNLFIDQYRKNRHVGDFDSAIEPSFEASIDDSLITADLLSKLPEAQRAVIVLGVIQGFNSVEIGELLGISSSAVRSRMGTALAKLRTVVEERSYL